MDKILIKFRILYLIIFITSISLSFSGCAGIPFFGDDDEEEVELESEFSEFEDGEGELSIEAEEMQTDIKTLQSQQEESQLKIEELENVVTSLESKLGEVSSAQIEDLKDTIHELESEMIDLKDNIAQFEFETKLKANSKGASKSNPKKNYNKALQLYNIKQYKESLRVFKSLDNRRTPLDLRDNVLFWMGQCYLKLEKFQKAVEKFSKVTTDYKGGNKVTDALYGAGLSYNFLGEKSKALSSLEQALNRGPTADMRKKIEKVMAEING